MPPRQRREIRPPRRSARGRSGRRLRRRHRATAARRRFRCRSRRAARLPRHARRRARPAAPRSRSSRSASAPRQFSSRSTKPRSGVCAPPSAARSPAKPGAGRGPRIAASSRRARSRNASGASPPAASGCFSAASSGTGASRAVGEVEHQAQKRAGRRAVERHSGGIVDVDVPAAQFGGDPAGQLAIRSDQRGGRARGFQLAAQQQRDRRRLVLRTGAIVAGDAGERVWRFGRVGRARHRSPRPAAAPRRPAAAVGPRPASAAAPVRRAGQSRDLAGGESRGRAAAARIRCCGWVGSSRDQLPLVGIAAAVEPGQDHHRPGRARRSTDKQLGQGGHAAGQTGGDDRRGRRRSRQSAAWRRSSRLRRSAGSSAPSASRIGGHSRGRMSRNRSTICQCSARSAGARSRSPSKLAPSPPPCRAAGRGAPPARRPDPAIAAGRRARAPAQHQPGQQQAAAQLGDRRRDGERRVVGALGAAERRSRRRRCRRSGAAAATAAANPGRCPRRSGAETPRARPAPLAGSATAPSCASAAAGRRRPAPAARALRSPETAGPARSCRLRRLGRSVPRCDRSRSAAIARCGARQAASRVAASPSGVPTWYHSPSCTIACSRRPASARS